MENLVKYSDFGAKGDGKTNDAAAICAAHKYANEHNLKVRADDGAVYYIGEIAETAVVLTDTDWSGARFIIDDSEIGVEKRGMNLFAVKSAEESYPLRGLDRLAADAENIGVELPAPSLVFVENSDRRMYIREGLNQNGGSPQSDIIAVDRDGRVDPRAPVMWNYDHITDAYAIAIDKTPLTLRGGEFTTIANRAPSMYTYYSRGINISRSNVTVEGLTHYIEGEGEHGAPYAGILQINRGANITVSDCLFTAHKTYQLVTDERNPMGSYDITPSNVVNLTFKHCRQTTDILDRAYWGLIGSNFCKNITLEDCVFSRFDAHQGVYNVAIRGCSLGHQCLNTIGRGLLSVESSTLYGGSFINLRSDYGSTWDGDFIVKNCKWVPNQGHTANNSVFINGSFNGFHDFGYDCSMPDTVTIEGLFVDDSHCEASHGGIYIFGNITPARVSSDYDERVKKEGFPYRVTRRLNISGFSSASGKKWRLAENDYMFGGVQINEY